MAREKLSVEEKQVPFQNPNSSHCDSYWKMHKLSENIWTFRKILSDAGPVGHRNQV